MKQSAAPDRSKEITNKLIEIESKLSYFEKTKFKKCEEKVLRNIDSLSSSKKSVFNDMAYLREDLSSLKNEFNKLNDTLNKVIANIRYTSKQSDFELVNRKADKMRLPYLVLRKDAEKLVDNLLFDR